MSNLPILNDSLAIDYLPEFVLQRWSPDYIRFLTEFYMSQGTLDPVDVYVDGEDTIVNPLTIHVKNIKFSRDGVLVNYKSEGNHTSHYLEVTFDDINDRDKNFYFWAKYSFETTYRDLSLANGDFGYEEITISLDEWEVANPDKVCLFRIAVPETGSITHFDINRYNVSLSIPKSFVTFKSLYDSKSVLSSSINGVVKSLDQLDLIFEPTTTDFSISSGLHKLDDFVFYNPEKVTITLREATASINQRYGVFVALDSYGFIKVFYTSVQNSGDPLDVSGIFGGSFPSTLHPLWYFEAEAIAAGNPIGFNYVSGSERDLREFSYPIALGQTESSSNYIPFNDFQDGIFPFYPSRTDYFQKAWISSDEPTLPANVKVMQIEVPPSESVNTPLKFSVYPSGDVRFSFKTRSDIAGVSFGLGVKYYDYEGSLITDDPNYISFESDIIYNTYEFSFEEPSKILGVDVSFVDFYLSFSHSQGTFHSVYLYAFRAINSGLIGTYDLVISSQSSFDFNFGFSGSSDEPFIYDYSGKNVYVKRSSDADDYSLDHEIIFKGDSGRITFAPDAVIRLENEFSKVSFLDNSTIPVTEVDSPVKEVFVNSSSCVYNRTLESYSIGDYLDMASISKIALESPSIPANNQVLDITSVTKNVSESLLSSQVTAISDISDSQSWKDDIYVAYLQGGNIFMLKYSYDEGAKDFIVGTSKQVNTGLIFVDLKFINIDLGGVNSRQVIVARSSTNTLFHFSDETSGGSGGFWDSAPTVPYTVNSNPAATADFASLELNGAYDVANSVDHLYISGIKGTGVSKSYAFALLSWGGVDHYNEAVFTEVAVINASQYQVGSSYLSGKFYGSFPGDYASDAFTIVEVDNVGAASYFNYAGFVSAAISSLLVKDGEILIYLVDTGSIVERMSFDSTGGFVSLGSFDIIHTSVSKLITSINNSNLFSNSDELIQIVTFASNDITSITSVNGIDYDITDIISGLSNNEDVLFGIAGNDYFFILAKENASTYSLVKYNYLHKVVHVGELVSTSDMILSPNPNINFLFDVNIDANSQDDYVTDKVNGSFPVSAYTSGTEVNLDSPSGVLDTPQVPVFMSSLDVTTNGFSLLIGSNEWNTSIASPILGDSILQAYTSGAYGDISIHPQAGLWNDFLPSLYNGVLRFYLPKVTSGDYLGGFIDIYYIEDAMRYAFEGTAYSMYLAQNGSIYLENNIGDPTKLVVRWDGVRGYAGGGQGILDTTNLYNSDITNLKISNSSHLKGLASTNKSFGNNISPEILLNNSIENNLFHINNANLSNLNIRNDNPGYNFRECNNIYVNGTVDGLKTVGQGDLDE